MIINCEISEITRTKNIIKYNFYYKYNIIKNIIKYYTHVISHLSTSMLKLD